MPLGLPTTHGSSRARRAPSLDILTSCPRFDLWSPLYPCPTLTPRPVRSVTHTSSDMHLLPFQQRRRLGSLNPSPFLYTLVKVVRTGKHLHFLALWGLILEENLLEPSISFWLTIPLSSFPSCLPFLHWSTVSAFGTLG